MLISLPQSLALYTFLQTADVENVGDVHINQGDPDDNDNERNYLQIDTYDQTNVLLKFNKSSISGSSITQANLSLYVNIEYVEAFESYDVAAHRLYNTYQWDEGTVTWNLGPAAGTDYNVTAVDTQNVGDGTDDTWITWDVTDIVRQESNDNFSIYLIPSGNGIELSDLVRFRSKEHITTATRPKIGIEYEESLADPCEYSGAGNFIVNNTNNCSFTADLNIDGNVTLMNIDSVYLNATWHFNSTDQYIYFQNVSSFYMESPGQII